MPDKGAVLGQQPSQMRLTDGQQLLNVCLVL